MAGYVQEVRLAADCVRHVSDSLAFPWSFPGKALDLGEAAMKRSAAQVFSAEAYPPFTRSLRDGFALRAADTTGASASSPVFLRWMGEVAMGDVASVTIGREECCAIATGGALPDGCDSVVMLEDTAAAGDWIEVRRAVQDGENVLREGEDISRGAELLKTGQLIDGAVSGLLASMGVLQVAVLNPVIGILSTGDEIRPVSEAILPPGCVRDANAPLLAALLKQYGFEARNYGIAPDDEVILRDMTAAALRECDVLILSGGSSVGMRDHCAALLASLPPPGLLVRGVNMIPGKPTLIGGDLSARKIVFGLPGHPLSCLTTFLFVVMPIILRMIGFGGNIGRFMRLQLAADLRGQTGPEEYTLMRIQEGRAWPLAAKSGYVSAAGGADGFIRLAPNEETKRRGEEVDVWIW